MEKKIPVQSLRVGMFLSEPVYHLVHGEPVLLLEKDIVITSQKQIEVLRRQRIPAVIIDPEKGTDLPEKLVWADPEPEIPPALVEKFQETRRQVSQYRVLHSKAVSITTSLFQNIRAGKELSLEQVKEVTRGTVASILENPDAALVVSRLEEHESYTFKHSVNVSIFVLTLARRMLHITNPEELLNYGMGGLLHDIGKMRVPVEVINKPGMLDPREWELMRKHPLWSAEILGEMPGIPEMVIRMSRSHHEKMDGTGYPDGLEGADLPREVLLTAIADVYDALTTKRSYKPALQPGNAIRQISLWRGKEFPAELVDGFTSSMGIYPVGSLVELSDGTLAVVADFDPVNPYEPLVIRIRDSEGKPLEAVKYLHLSGYNRYRKEPLTIARIRRPEEFGVDIADYLQAG